ncbi:hypothetical protein GGTG_10793 [Gaeumannomyces tritici R3-111a-1]|uniref:Uncharacterized protein n=1 Tax=Gaeumannomyces tritici (strain R3-111a-1) TaxID=644352 RepID=J3PBC0_GAET3|nr:hypothetical protein GGTG_10793 [Gaeumannomyces tritici R3-111a-1]EJT71536.1 hypothetical protein GGTG_10793 [Gaeumannomyces tritici R3-111a-1]
MQDRVRPGARQRIRCIYGHLKSLQVDQHRTDGYPLWAKSRIGNNIFGFLLLSVYKLTGT